MTEPTRTSTGIAYLTYDATLNTDTSMIIQQKLDLSGNTSVQTFCENAFNLAAERDISGALLADSDITDYDTNNLVYLGSNDLNVQKTFLSANENSTKAQLIALNAYEMTLGKNNQIPLVSKLGIIPPVVVSKIKAAYKSFAALKTDGSVLTWGDSDWGGDSSSVSSSLYSDVVNIYSTHGAFAALKKDGSVVTWGGSGHGGDSSDVSNNLTSGVSEIYSTCRAFAALKSDGSVVSWGNKDPTVSFTKIISSNVVSIFTNWNGVFPLTNGSNNYSVFVAFKSDGSIESWGLERTGGNLGEIWGIVNNQHAKVGDVSDKLTNNSEVSKLIFTDSNCAALKTDGSVVVWGSSTNIPTSDISNNLIGVTDLYSTNIVTTFAALKTDGSVVTWGDSGSGGDSSSVSSSLSSGVSVIYSTGRAFAALKTDGSVVTWGRSDWGGDTSHETYGISSGSVTSGVSVIYPSLTSFAALKTDGSVVTWGASNWGGDSSSVSSLLSSGVSMIYSVNSAFAAVKQDGEGTGGHSVVTWGNSTSGGDSSDVSNILTSGVSVIYNTTAAFAALKTDGSVVTWGLSTHGGDSSGVQFLGEHPILLCLTENSQMNIVNSKGNKYVLNGETEYSSRIVYGLNNGTDTRTYTITNIPVEHPLAILNTGNSNISYSFSGNQYVPIATIKVSGGSTSPDSYGDYYTFHDENDNQIHIADGSYKFSRAGYKFVDNGIDTNYPFRFPGYTYIPSSTGGNNYISVFFFLENNFNINSGIYYECSNNSNMKGYLHFYYKEVNEPEETTASYDFFHGSIDITVTGDFDKVSMYCYWHGYMGGKNLLEYSDTC